MLKLQAFNLRSLQDCLSILTMMERQGVSISEARQQLEKTQNPKVAYRQQARVSLGDCPSCGQPLYLCLQSQAIYCRKCYYSRLSNG